MPAASIRGARARPMRDILVLCPQERDLNAIRAAGLEERYRVHFVGSDLDQLEVFDPVAFLASARRSPPTGGRHEGPVGAPRRAPRRAPRAAGPEPARWSPPAQADCPRVQQQVAPEATPRFAVLDGARRSTSRSSSSPSSGACRRTSSGSTTRTTCTTCTRSTATRRATPRSPRWPAPIRGGPRVHRRGAARATR